MTDLKGSYLQSKQDWEETTLKPALGHRPERQEQFLTTSSTPIDRLYIPTGAALSKTTS